MRDGFAMLAGQALAMETKTIPRVAEINAEPLTTALSSSMILMMESASNH
jgi:hypothetical protein